jgi:hypothetical protein
MVDQVGNIDTRPRQDGGDLTDHVGYIPVGNQEPMGSPLVQTAVGKVYGIFNIPGF